MTKFSKIFGFLVVFEFFGRFRIVVAPDPVLRNLGDFSVRFFQTFFLDVRSFVSGSPIGLRASLLGAVFFSYRPTLSIIPIGLTYQSLSFTPWGIFVCLSANPIPLTYRFRTCGFCGKVRGKVLVRPIKQSDVRGRHTTKQNKTKQNFSSLQTLIRGILQ